MLPASGRIEIPSGGGNGTVHPGGGGEQRVRNDWSKIIWCAMVLALLSVCIPGVSMLRGQELDAGGEAGKMLGSTWETRTQARTLVLLVPPPRGQLADRHGNALALNRVVYNLAINFPYFEGTDDATVLSYAHRRVDVANRVLEKDWSLEDEVILKHYANRRWLPLPFSGVLSEPEMKTLEPLLDQGLIIHPSYQRYYPEGAAAAHVVGYVGKTRPLPTGPIESGDPLFVEMEGRDGLELAFDEYLSGTPGKINVLFDADGTKLREEMVERPMPGHNVVMTIDLGMQRQAERVLRTRASRGALVMVDVYSGEIVVLASWPRFDPNVFVPFISKETFDGLQNDPDLPLYARAFRGLYPPASTFKVPVALAALESGTIDVDSVFDCPNEYFIGDRMFHNWNKYPEGPMNVVQAIKRSCNTWFYQVGDLTGSHHISIVAMRLGLGMPTGIPVRGEPKGFMPTDEWSLKNFGHRILAGDLANISIGQGRILASPLQMAQLMAGVAHGESIPKMRLVKQVQTVHNKVVKAFPAERGTPLNVSASSRNLVVQGMIGVVNAADGTGKGASHNYLTVAGKTGTAQWGATEDDKKLGWFAGFVPADYPRYAFVALYEGDPGEYVTGGRKAAPIVGAFLGEVFGKEASATVVAEAKALAREDLGVAVAKAEVLAEPVSDVQLVSPQDQEKMQRKTEGPKILRWWNRLRRYR